MFNDIIKKLESELHSLNNNLTEILKTSVVGFDEILNYIYNSRGKQIRPIIGILFSKIFDKYDKNIETFLCSIELIHNATLFHDDVIDESDYRHNLPALHKKFSNKLAILTGDYFFATAIKNIYSLKNDKINALFSSYMQQICEGEIEQDISLNKIVTIDEYLCKIRKKTGLLFELITNGIIELTNLYEYREEISDFGKNFGILFQIYDDLKNFQQEKDKPVLNDLKSGIITAPIIFLTQEKPEVKIMIKNQNYDEVLKQLESSDAIQKTKNLLNFYYLNAETALQKLPENEYGILLLNLLSEFRNY